MSRIAHATFAAPGLEAERRNLDATVRHEAAQRAAARVHLHVEQFDGAQHSWCGRGTTAAPTDVFEATPSADRCKLCERDWFPNGQPDWHLKQAQERVTTTKP